MKIVLKDFIIDTEDIKSVIRLDTKAIAKGYQVSGRYYNMKLVSIDHDIVIDEEDFKTIKNALGGH